MSIQVSLGVFRVGHNEESCRFWPAVCILFRWHVVARETAQDAVVSGQKDRGPGLCRTPPGSTDRVNHKGRPLSNQPSRLSRVTSKTPRYWAVPAPI